MGLGDMLVHSGFYGELSVLVKGVGGHSKNLDPRYFDMVFFTSYRKVNREVFSEAAFTGFP